MYPTIIEAQYGGEYSLWLRFSDGAEGHVDLSAELHGEVFEPLLDKKFFKAFKLHDELGTVYWDNGADFAPEFLRAVVRQAA